MLAVDKSHFNVVNYMYQSETETTEVENKCAPANKKKLDPRKKDCNMMYITAFGNVQSVDDCAKGNDDVHMNYNISSYLFFRRKLIFSS